MAKVKAVSKTKKKTAKKKIQTKKPTPKSPREKRIELIREIEEMRKSRVITYLTSDRVGAPLAQIGEDAIRPMYNHVRHMPRSSKIDLFLYSRGGGIEVPWRIVTMLRERCKHLGVLIPYKAHSAATLIALGSDEIVMGEKAELGPIDPLRETRVDNRKEPVSVEDVMSFIRFNKDVAGLTDQSAISKNVQTLVDKLSPWFIGSIYRIHTHIRIVAQKMLSSHTKAITEAKINRITETLAEKVYSHGHAICRSEAKDIGLPVIRATRRLDTALWQLFNAYEDLLQLNTPLDIHASFPANIDEISLPMTTAVIESKNITSGFTGTFKMRRIRQTPPQLNFNFNIGLQLPPNIDNKIPKELQQSIKETLEKVKNQAPKWIMEQTKKQSPVVKVEHRFENAFWRDLTEIGD